MKRVDKKIAKMINKSVEYKLKSVFAATLDILPIVPAASQNLPVLNYITLSHSWPSQGSGQETRIGNTMKKVTTYFTMEFRLYLNNGATAASQIAQTAYRIIIFTTHETLDTGSAIPQFFQFNTNGTGITPMINPTNKAKIVVLYDKVHNTPVNPNLGIAYATTGINQRRIMRYSRKFKDITFAVNSDTSPQKPTAYTYLAVFSDGIYSTSVKVGDLHWTTRYYWVD